MVQTAMSIGHPHMHVLAKELSVTQPTAAFVAVFSPWKRKGGRGNRIQYSGFLLASGLGHLKRN